MKDLLLSQAYRANRDQEYQQFLHTTRDLTPAPNRERVQADAPISSLPAVKRVSTCDQWPEFLKSRDALLRLTFSHDNHAGHGYSCYYWSYLKRMEISFHGFSRLSKTNSNRTYSRFVAKSLS